MTGKEALINLSKTCMAYQEEFGRIKIDKKDNEALQVLLNIVQKYDKYKRAFEILKNVSIIVVDKNFMTINTNGIWRNDNSGGYDVLKEVLGE